MPPHPRLPAALLLALLTLPAVPASAAGQPGLKGRAAFTNVVPVDQLPGLAPPAAARDLTPLSPADAARSFEVFPDLAWDLVLSEPEIAQPVFLTFDDRARLWVVEYRQYPHPAGLKMVSRDNFWRAVYDKVPPPPPHHFRGADRISIHEDSDGDGSYDRHRVFVDGLNIATSVAFGRGGVYVLNPPYLLFYPDADADDVPDGDPRVLLSGFGLEDTHSVANSLRWGPDGWLYGCQGSTVTANVRVHGPDGTPSSDAPVYSQGQNIWRYHPVDRRYEVFSEGGGNAFGLEMDSAGRVFSGHNGGNTRGFHYQQGAYLQKGFDKHGPLSNPYAFGYFPQMPHPDVDRFTHTFLIQDSGALGGRYEGRLFGVEPLQGRVVLSEITADGSTFRTRDLGHPVTTSDRWFRPVDIKLGPDGALYVADWYDRQVNHYRNHEGQMDAANGRVYRLRSHDASPGRSALPWTEAGARDLRDADSLTRALGHRNRWVRETARNRIADRPDRKRTAILRNFLAAAPDATPVRPLEAFWALVANGDWNDALATETLRHPDAQVRLWTVRLLGDRGVLRSDLAAALADLAAAEPDIEVRAQLAATARRVSPSAAMPILRQLLAHDRDASDPRLPLMLWWAVEEHCGRDPGAVLGLLSDRELWRAPLVEGTLLPRLARRFAATGRREDLLVCARLFAASPGPTQTAALTRGFEEAFQGRPMSGLPDELLEAMARAGGESVLIGTRRGQPAAVREALALVADPGADATRRLHLVQALGETRVAEAVPVLLALARDERSASLRQAALSALQGFDDPAIASELLPQLGSHPPAVRATAIGLLASRPAWATILLRGVDTGTVPRDAMPVDVIRRLKDGAEGEMAALIQRHWPAIRQATSAELEAEIGRLAELLDLATGSPYAGKALFREHCGGCHRLFGQGGEVGPDLTAYQRTDLPNLLLNIVNPNAEVREGYEAYLVGTRDGRELVGFLADQDDQVIVLRTGDGRTVTLPRAEVDSREAAGGSLMPEGLLAGLGDQQIRDLFAYLRSTQPLNDGN